MITGAATSDIVTRRARLIIVIVVVGIQMIVVVIVSGATAAAARSCPGPDAYHEGQDSDATKDGTNNDQWSLVATCLDLATGPIVRAHLHRQRHCDVIRFVGQQ